jgi:hypothetical protein
MTIIGICVIAIGVSSIFQSFTIGRLQRQIELIYREIDELTFVKPK